jgi:hypothetical protein
VVTTIAASAIATNRAFTDIVFVIFALSVEQPLSPWGRVLLLTGPPYEGSSPAVMSIRPELVGKKIPKLFGNLSDVPGRLRL